MNVMSLYSVQSRYIAPIENLTWWEIYRNTWHSAGLIHTSSAQPNPGPTELGIGPIPVHNLLRLHWTGLGWTLSGLVLCWTGGIIVSVRMTDVNAGRMYQPQAGGLNRIYFGNILIIQSQNAILFRQVSISGLKINFWPQCTPRLCSKDVVPIWQCTLPAGELRSD